MTVVGRVGAPSCMVRPLTAPGKTAARRPCHGDRIPTIMLSKERVLLGALSDNIDIMYTLVYNLGMKGGMNMPTRRMSAKEARANFGDLLGLVHYTGEPVIIERKGRPFAVVISPEQYQIIEKQIEKSWSTIDSIRERNADKNPEEVLRDVTELVEGVRQEHYERSKKEKTTRSRH